MPGHVTPSASHPFFRVDAAADSQLGVTRHTVLRLHSLNRVSPHQQLQKRLSAPETQKRLSPLETWNLLPPPENGSSACSTIGISSSKYLPDYITSGYAFTAQTLQNQDGRPKFLRLRHSKTKSTCIERRNSTEKVRRERSTLVNKVNKLSLNGANVYKVVEYNAKFFLYNSRPNEDWVLRLQCSYVPS